MNAVFQQAAAEGIGVYFASGDDGDNGPPPGAFRPGSPTRARGSRRSAAPASRSARRGGYEWEAGWGTTTSDWNGSEVGAEGAGRVHVRVGRRARHVFPMPWLPGRGRPARGCDLEGDAAPDEPDLAMDADPQTGVTFAQTYVAPNGHRRIIDSWIGGTSLASPLVAGVMALADQRSGRPHGFINPALYRLRGTPALHDVMGGHQTLAVLRNALAARRARSSPGCARSTATARSQPRPAGIRSPASAR